MSSNVCTDVCYVLNCDRFTLLSLEDQRSWLSIRVVSVISLRVSELGMLYITKKPLTCPLSYSNNTVKNTPEQQQINICLGAVSVPLCFRGRIHISRNGRRCSRQVRNGQLHLEAPLLTRFLLTGECHLRSLMNCNRSSYPHQRHRHRQTPHLPLILCKERSDLSLLRL